MLTRGLVALMRRAESPTAIMTAAFLLEKATGLSTKNIIDETAFTFTEGGQQFRESDWLQRNGYNRLAAALGGYSSYTGRTISPESAVELAALYGGVKIIAEDMGTLPCFVYRRGPNRTTERDYTHPLYQALHDLPNPEIGAGEFVEMLTAHAVLGLDGFARIDRIGRRIYLWPLMPPNIRTDRSARGALVYIVREPKGSEVTYERDRIFHLRGMMLLNDARGDEVLKRARHVLGLGLAGQEYVGRFYANDASPGVIITRPVGSALLGPEKMLEVKEAWMRWHQGLRRAHEPAILEAGAQAMRLDPDHQKLQLLEARKFAVLEVCRILRISPHKLGDLDRATFCLPGSAEVFTAEGPKRIDQVRTDEDVWTHDGRAWEKRTVRRVSCTGRDEILTIRSTNRTIRLNSSHRVLARLSRLVGATVGATIRPGQHPVAWETQWIEAGDLSVGDTIVALDRLPAEGKDDIPSGRQATIGFLEFCGLLLGDGNISMAAGNPVGVQIARAAAATYMDPYRETMMREFRSWTGGGTGESRTRVERLVRLQEGHRQTRFSSVLAATELQFLGFSGTARTKRVPGWVFGMSERYRVALLRGFLDADGSVDKLGRISFSSCNCEMLSQIRHLCMSVGVPVTNQRLQIGQTKLPNGRMAEYRQYTFTCSNPEANLRIGSHAPEYIRRMGGGQAFGRKQRRYPRHGGRDFQMDGCGLTRIAAIERSGPEPVFDLEVDGNHNFVADGVVVHNSNIEQLNIDHVTHTLSAWVRRWRQAIYRCLLTESEQLADSLYAEHEVAALLKGDFKTQSDGFRALLEKGVFSINEVRRLMNLNPVEGGDEHFIQLNMATVQDVATGAALSGKDLLSLSGGRAS